VRDGNGDGRQTHRHGWIPLSPHYSPAPRNGARDWSDRDVETIRAARQNEWGETDYGDQSNQDPKLAKAWELQGFDGKPETLSPAEFDALPSGYERLYRGLHGAQAEQWAEEFRSGPAFAGLGVYGNGTYTTTNRESAEEYANLEGVAGGAMLEMALRPEARVIDIDKVWDEWEASVKAAGPGFRSCCPGKAHGNGL